MAKSRQEAGKRMSAEGSRVPPAEHMQLQQQAQQAQQAPPPHQAQAPPAGAAAEGAGGSGGAAPAAAEPAAGVLAADGTVLGAARAPDWLLTWNGGDARRRGTGTPA
ncbi:hypothetical protein ABPG77_004005 [Micractinium sp. CCAP 211/92]